MFCKKCGSEISECSQVCEFCGKALEENVKNNDTNKNHDKKKLKVLLGAIFLLVAISVFIFLRSDFYQSRKNVYLGNECYQEENWEEALEYYNEALYLDDTLIDVYLSCADIYVQEVNFDKAIKILGKGIRCNENGEESILLVDKLTEVFLGKIDDYINKDLFNDAHFTLTDAPRYIDAQVILNKHAEVYQREADYYMRESGFEDAKYILRLGYEKLEHSGLLQKLVDIYFMEADKYVEVEEYDLALELLTSGYKEYDDEAFQQKLIEVYRKKAEKYVEKKDLNSAVYTLVESYETTGVDSVLPEIAKMWELRVDNDFVAHNNFESALYWLDEAYAYTGIDSLIQKKKEVYLTWVDYYLEDDEFEKALQILETAAQTMDDLSLLEQRAGIYMQAFNYHARYQDWERAVSMLAEGATVTNNDELKQKEAELREKVVLVHQKEYYKGDLNREIQYDIAGNIVQIKRHSSWDDGWEYANYEYDDNNNMTKYTLTNKYDAIFESHECEYDSHGNMLKFIEYGENGLLEQISEYEYDENGKKTKLISSSYYNGERTSSIEWIYTYDDKGNMTKEQIINNDGILSDVYTWSYQYDEKGNKIIETCYNHDINEESVWKYDEKGNELEFSIYQNNELEYYLTYKYIYDDNGNIQEKCEYLWDALRAKIVYDMEGNRSEHYYIGGELRSISKYDSNNNCVEYSDYQGNVAENTTRYTYDSEGRLIKTLYYSINNTLLERWVDYEYDDFGNLTVKTSYNRGDEKGTILENVINTYFYVLEE